MSDEMQLPAEAAKNLGWIAATLLALWIAVLKFILKRYIETLEQNTVKLSAIDVRLARIEGGLGIQPGNTP